MVRDHDDCLVVKPDDVVSCSAESNYVPKFYQWFVEGEVVEIGRGLILHVECKGQEVCVTRLALNEMRGGILGTVSQS